MLRPTPPPTPMPTPTPTSTPLLLSPFLPTSPSTKLVVPVANDTAYSITVVYRSSSQDAHSTKLIDQYSFGMRSIGCSNRHLLLKLLLIYGSVFVSSSSSSSYSLLFCFSLRLPPSVHINFPWGNLSPLPPCLLPCSGLLSSQRLIHSTWRYFAGGIRSSGCYSQHLLHKPLPFCGFVLVFLSSSSSSSSSSS